MRFTVRTTYTKETIAALVAVSQLRTADGRKFRRLLVKGLGSVLTLVGSAGAVLFLLDFLHHLLEGRGYTWDRFTPALGAGLLLWTGLSLLLENRRLKKRREKLTEAIWRSYPDKGREAVFCFTQEAFSYKTAVSEASYSYSVLGDLITDGAYYYLYHSSTYAYVLKYSDFTEGDAAAFGSFLMRAAGRPVLRVGGEKGGGA